MNIKSIRAKNSFRKDIERVSKRGRKSEQEKLKEVLDLLLRGEDLPKYCKPHVLSGEWSGFWECHVAPDLLLIYLVDEVEVTLFRIGTHSDLFK